MKSEINEGLKLKLKDGVLSLIHDDRLESNNRNQRELIAKLIHVMLALGFYKSDFERTFIEQTQSFFKADSLFKLGSLDVTNICTNMKNS